MEKKDYKKEFRKVSKELKDLKKKYAERLQAANYKIADLNDLERENENLRQSLDIADSHTEKGKIERIYLEGQLTVLKRMSGLYQEEKMTHEEWMKRSREILSEIDCPF